jgi:hypothetical protein
MASFFSRHRVDLDAPAAKPGNDGYPSAGVIAWLLWGGDPANPDEAGAAWADRKLDEIDGQRDKGIKAEGDRVSATPAKPSERIEGSDTNKPGSASGSRGGIQISEAQEKALKKKVEEHNEKHGDKKGKKVDLGMLKAVYRRGAGAFSTSHRPGISRQAWSMARVNAFLYLVRNGRPEDAKYTTDNDLLPKGHPKKSESNKQLDVRRDEEEVGVGVPIRTQILRQLDTNGDGVVNAADIVDFQLNPFDYNGDGVIDGLDFGEFFGDWGEYVNEIVPLTEAQADKLAELLAKSPIIEDIDEKLKIAGGWSKVVGVGIDIPNRVREQLIKLDAERSEDADAAPAERPAIQAPSIGGGRGGNGAIGSGGKP